jgi:hypothetical protein
MRYANALKAMVCSILLATLAGCDASGGGCSKCDEFEELESSIENYEEGLADFYEATGTVEDDWSFQTDCADHEVSGVETAYFCNITDNLCEYQRDYNECIEDSCSAEEVEVVCD